MNIGLIGYLGWGNYGDELFKDVYINISSDSDIKMSNINKMIKDPYFEDEDIKIYDAFIIVGGDILNPGYISNLYWSEKIFNLNKPILIYNLGYPNWIKENDDILNKYKFFLNNENVKRIHCRDSECKEFIIKKISNEKEILTTTDITVSLFEEEPKSENIICFNFRCPYTFEYDYSKVLELSHDLKSSYKIKILVAGVGKIGDDDKLEATKLKKLLDDNNIENELIIPEKIDEISDFLKKCSIIITNKFHVFVVGSVLGKKTISTSGNNKFVNFAKFFNISNHLIPISIIDKKIENLESNFNRQILKEECQKITKMIKEDISYLKNII